MVKNKKLHIIGILAIVASAMAACGAFADKVVVLPNSEVTTSAKM